MTQFDQIQEILKAKRGSVIRSWLDALLATYAEQAASFMRSQKDQFANPVGSTFKAALENVYDELMVGVDPERVAPLLDPIVRIRAVQEFMPSDALAFIVILKDILRQKVFESLSPQEWTELDNRVDRMALLAFDIYSGCRERIYQIRIQEMERNNHMLWRRSGMLEDAPADS
jgi:hypothetical protein